MLPPTDTEIRNRVQAFANDLSELLRASVLEVAATALGAPGRSAPRGGSAPAPSRLRKGEKRAPAMLAALVDDLAAHIARSPGQRIEEIGRALGISTRELALPAKKLIADKRVRTQGEKRATRYYPAGGRSVASAKPGRARKAKKTGRRAAKAGRPKKSARQARGKKKAGKKRAARKSGRKPRAAKRGPAKRVAAKRASVKPASKPRASAAPPAEKLPEASAAAV